MGKLFQSATEQASLKAAWRRIRSNGIFSSASETRIAIEMFDREEGRNIHNIQKRLRSGSFEFEPQKGVLKKKKSGGNRGIVMASVHNRVVERAWLDCLQTKSEFVRKVITVPTSVGGVPHRSVPHGLRLIRDAFSAGKTHYVRSDISGFFDHIPRALVLDKIGAEINDDKFLDTLRAATTVVLANEAALGEDRRVFPTDDEGVAQGSPLSPLFGNALLYDFNARFNGRGLICVRFIDDFILLGDNENSVVKAFQGAKEMLNELGLACHDPFSDRANNGKAAFGQVKNGFVFLGYDIRPGLFQPSRQAREKLESVVEGHIYLGKQAVLDVKKASNSFESRQRYVQTQVLVDKVLRGWGEAFAYGNAPTTLEDLDARVDAHLNKFRAWFSSQIKELDWKNRRRLGGVCLLSDISQKNLDDVPFVLEAGPRFVRSANTVTVSTDGSVAIQSKRKGKDQGPGGWSFVLHETGEEGCGNVASATNNQMELRAVIEAIRFADPKKSMIIRTDSQYVHDAVNRGNTIKSNTELWNEFREVKGSRRIKITWVKGHSGDRHNERADHLASVQANLAKTKLTASKVDSNESIDLVSAA
jgi:ribonuclease HI/retron-type reverse transcriptase